MIKMKKISAGIVTYNPKMQRLEENINAIIGQVEEIIVVDNASANIKEIEQSWADNPKITLIKNNENRGIATALNQIMEYSLKQGYVWTLTLDEDSVVPEDMIEKYMDYIDRGNTAMIVPIICDRVMSEIDIKEEINSAYTLVENAITSGTLMNNLIWKKVGGFTEELFIDYVDFDYCMKVRLAKYDIVRVNSVKLLHELGNATEIKLFTFLEKLCKDGSEWKRRFSELRYTTNHSPKRVYYVTRNQYYYINHYRPYFDAKRLEKGMRIGWIVKLIFEKDRIKKFKAIRNGIKDGKKM